jgi:hypothetical protein
MKTSILVAGFCLLALTSTITEALEKKQQDTARCATLTLDSAVVSCLTDLTSQEQSSCTGSCKNTLGDYYAACGLPRELYDTFCEEFGGGSSAATVGVTLFTIVSAALVAVGN